MDNDSPLVKDFLALWTSLRLTCQNELTPLAFSEIPDERLVAKNFVEVMKKL
jgi:hypothetical protein